MLDMHRLRLLRELSYRGTIASTAQSLGYTASAVSQQLSVLEREAGVALLERTGRKATLTPAGRRLVAHAEDLLAHLEQAESSLAQMRHGVTSTLRLGAFPAAARVILPRALVVLGREHPHLELLVEEIDPQAAPDALRSGELDVALTHRYQAIPTVDQSGVESIALFTEPLCVTALHPIKDLGDLRDEPWIVGRPRSDIRLVIEHLCHEAGFPPRVRHQTDDFPTTLALVTAGQGVAVLPRIGTVGRPEGVEITRLASTSTIDLTYRRGSRDHPAVVAFQEAMAEAIEQHRRDCAAE